MLRLTMSCLPLVLLCAWDAHAASKPCGPFRLTSSIQVLETQVRLSCRQGQVVGIGYPATDIGQQIAEQLEILFCVPKTRRPVGRESVFICIYNEM